MEKRFDMQRMLQIQDELQAKYAGKWEPIKPETARNKLLWGIAEIGEVIQVIKKRGEEEVMEDPEVRSHFVEELVDVYMYMADVLNCMQITAEEFALAYEKKHAHNMCRDWGKEIARMFEERED